MENGPARRYQPRSTSPKSSSKLSTAPAQVHSALRLPEAVYDLDWCLELLENLQTKKSISSLASLKFQKQLNRELSQGRRLSDGELISVAEEGACDDRNSTSSGNRRHSSRTAAQISDYICQTFLEQDEDEKFVSNGEDSVECRDLQDTVLARSDSQAEASKIRTNKITLKPEEIEDTNDPCQSSELARYGFFASEHGCNVVKLDEVFEKRIETWGMDIFELQELTNGHLLSMIAFNIFKVRVSIFITQQGSSFLLIKFYVIGTHSRQISIKL
ncbi:hypothetical protein Ciccas_012143 [Cichlidogyrus casuarinus]|uniref:3',5'-cyclic-AMP phosphodiesterase n=1 Tax=Cichlidogyrus casuarinus TaxID=1844966 RepID=A0ABD2PSA7_9PLAT